MTAILSLAPFQQRPLWERFRDRAHEALAALLDRLEAGMTQPGRGAPDSPRPWWRPLSNAAMARC